MSAVAGEKKALIQEKGKQASTDLLPKLNASLLCLLGVSAIDEADVRVFPSMMKAVESTMGFSLTDFGWLNVVRAFTSACIGPAWARLADTGDRRVLMSGACLAWGIVTGLCGLCSNQLSFVALMVINGMLLTSMGPIAQSIVPDMSAPEERGRMFGFLSFGGYLGVIAATMIVTPIAGMEIFGMEGWRYAMLALAFISVAASVLVFACFEEPRSVAKMKEIEKTSSIQLYLDIVRNKTWLLVCLQGIFGSIPYSALAFITMWLQYLGLSDVVAASIVSLQIVGHILGAFIAGFVGDWAAMQSPDHGRIWCAIIADSIRSPVLLATFLLAPQFGTEAAPYAICVFLIGFLMPWPSITCGKPIFTEIVPENGRGAIVAAQTIVERCCGSVGGLFVGYIAMTWYGYDTATAHETIAEMTAEQRMVNANALGNAMLVSSVLPWVLCTILYGLVHFTYKHDRDAVVQIELASLSHSA